MRQRTWQAARRGASSVRGERHRDGEGVQCSRGEGGAVRLPAATSEVGERWMDEGGTCRRRRAVDG